MWLLDITFVSTHVLQEQGKNPLQIDSKEPNWDKYDEYLMGETRYAQLKSVNPEKS